MVKAAMYINTGSLGLPRDTGKRLLREVGFFFFLLSIQRYWFLAFINYLLICLLFAFIFVCCFIGGFVWRQTTTIGLPLLLLTIGGKFNLELCGEIRLLFWKSLETWVFYSLSRCWLTEQAACSVSVMSLKREQIRWGAIFTYARGKSLWPWMA